LAWLLLGATFTSFRGTSPALGSPHGCMKGSHMKNVSTGAGLCVLGLCIVGYPLVDRISTRAEAGVPAAGAVAAAALAQDPPAPTIVWYAVSGDTIFQAVWRAWSNGRIEMRRVQLSGWMDSSWCANNVGYPCKTPWIVVSDPGEGYSAAADLNFDEAVDGVDLGVLLGKWGPAPRLTTPPSDCPLALINP
jgi:hypothetical protein